MDGDGRGNDDFHQDPVAAAVLASHHVTGGAIQPELHPSKVATFRAMGSRNGRLPQQGRMNIEGLALESNIGLRSWLVLSLMARGKAEQCTQPVVGG